MKYGSVCSGIEAATVAWHPLGWTPAFFSEIDPFPRAVLQYHFRNVPLHGDFTTIQEHDYDTIDLLVGGTPCQAFSVAGLRKGFSDERGNLTLEFVRLAQRLRPRWVVWENVPGVLSIDGGRAFGSFLGALAELGYGFAYRVLDAQYFGVPQRRRRVFVVGYLGDWRPPAAVLFERESLLRDITPRRETRENPSCDVAPSLTSSGCGVSRTGETRGQDPVIAVSHDPACTLTARDYKGPLPEADLSTVVAHTLTRRYDSSSNGTEGGLPIIPYTLAIRGRGETHDLEYRQDGTANAILTPNGGRCGIGVGAVAFSCKDHGADVGDTAPTLRAMGHDGSHANAGGQVAVAFAQNTRDEVRLIGGDGQVAGALAAEAGMKQQTYVKTAMHVRRLTPRECERLQGFPDEYTLIPIRRKSAFMGTCHSADGPRYKALGNSMAVPVMHWLGRRIDHVQAMLGTAA